MESELVFWLGETLLIKQDKSLGEDCSAPFTMLTIDILVKLDGKWASDHGPVCHHGAKTEHCKLTSVWSIKPSCDVDPTVSQTKVQYILEIQHEEVQRAQWSCTSRRAVSMYYLTLSTCPRPSIHTHDHLRDIYLTQCHKEFSPVLLLRSFLLCF
jgi:hypothetical protein